MRTENFLFSMEQPSPPAVRELWAPQLKGHPKHFILVQNIQATLDTPSQECFASTPHRLKGASEGRRCHSLVVPLFIMTQQMQPAEFSLVGKLYLSKFVHNLIHQYFFHLASVMYRSSTKSTLWAFNRFCTVISEEPV